MMRRRGGARRTRATATATATVTVGVVAAAAVLAACGVDPGVGDTVAPPSVTWTRERVAAGTFPTPPGYTLKRVPDEEWSQTWAALKSSYHGLLADGQARYVRDAGDDPVGIVVVAWPAPGRSGPSVMKAALDLQGQQAAEHDGTAGVKDVSGHDVLQFDDAYRQPNWYWVSGDEFVMVTCHDYDQGAAFVAALASATR